jgi:hypothetical protein
MKTNNIDKNIKEKFKNRTFTPSISAWERLSVQLDENSKQKKFGWFFYVGIAASILLLVSVGLQFFSGDVSKINPKEDIVISPIDKKNIDYQIEKLINEVPVPEAVVQKEIETEKEIVHAPVILKQNKKTQQKRTRKAQASNQRTLIAKVAEKNEADVSNKNKTIENKNPSVEILKQNPNSTVKINADDLLYAVTHTPKEVKAYYAKYNLNREDVLKTIKNELKKSNIKINPNTILAEVERNIDDEYFENNFMRGLKKRVSDIAVAIASRND